MRLALMRHGAAVPLTSAAIDFQRELTPYGRLEACEAAQWLHARRIPIESGACSPSTRTMETLRCVLTEMKRLDNESTLPPLISSDEPLTYPIRLYEATAGDLAIVVQSFKSQQDLTLVGHNPSIASFAQWLLGSSVRLWDFPTSSIALIEVPLERWGDISAGCGRLIDKR